MSLQKVTAQEIDAPTSIWVRHPIEIHGSTTGMHVDIRIQSTFRIPLGVWVLVNDYFVMVTPIAMYKVWDRWSV